MLRMACSTAGMGGCDGGPLAVFRPAAVRRRDCRKVWAIVAMSAC
jgi:hypothetical protein